jgi:hypothetical protein
MVPPAALAGGHFQAGRPKMQLVFLYRFLFLLILAGRN